MDIKIDEKEQLFEKDNLSEKIRVHCFLIKEVDI